LTISEKGPLFNFITVVGVLLERSEAQGGMDPDNITFMHFGHMNK
jgi:hypothetical protein